MNKRWGAYDMHQSQLSLGTDTRLMTEVERLVERRRRCLREIWRSGETETLRRRLADLNDRIDADIESRRAEAKAAAELERDLAHVRERIATARETILRTLEEIRTAPTGHAREKAQRVLELTEWAMSVALANEEQLTARLAQAAPRETEASHPSYCTCPACDPFATEPGVAFNPHEVAA